MSHEIDFTNNAKGAAMYADTPAWHGHGVVVKGCQTTEEALRLASLDWEVQTVPAFSENEDGTYRKASKVYLNRRSDTGAVLGAVGNRYTVLQNREALEWMDAVVGEGLALWNTAGSLKGGQRVWGLAQLPGDLEISEGDHLQKYVLISNTHDGTGAVTLMPTSVRVVCWNTLSLALSEGRRKTSTVRLKHLKGSLAARVDLAREALGLVNSAHEDFAATARQLQAAEINSQMLSDYFDLLVSYRSPKTQEKVKQELYEVFAKSTNEGQFGATVWTAFNAATEYADHDLRVSGSGALRAERRFESNLFGSSHTFKQKALDGALALVA